VHRDPVGHVEPQPDAAALDLEHGDLEHARGLARATDDD
jgi:hypothetical protein